MYFALPNLKTRLLAWMVVSSVVWLMNLVWALLAHCWWFFGAFILTRRSFLKGDCLRWGGCARFWSRFSSVTESGLAVLTEWLSSSKRGLPVVIGTSHAFQDSVLFARNCGFSWRRYEEDVPKFNTLSVFRYAHWGKLPLPLLSYREIYQYRR